ncbi:MAG: ABC transporter permease [Chloroflexi bacterium]|nr:ABC transporter permease [Chloroflexota bacterium]MBV9598685.1 ABC transporter permease [Chloroflexota bacterium]
MAIRRLVLRQAELGPTLGLALAVAVFSLLSPHFFDPQSLTAITTGASEVGIVAVAVSLLMIAGELDLSVGAVYAFIPVLWVILFRYDGLLPIVALAIALAGAALVGLVSGLTTVRFSVPSIIVTLGMFFALEGLNNLLIGGGDLVVSDRDWLLDVFGQRLGSTPFFAALLWLLVITFLGWFLLTRTAYGNWTQAAGGRLGVARAMGVPVGPVKVSLFVLTAVLAGFAGCLQTAYLRSVTAAQGQDLALLAITASVVGGTSIYGGSGSVIGAVLGALLLSVLQVGLIVVGAPGTFYVTFIGVFLVVVVIVNSRLTARWRTGRSA